MDSSLFTNSQPIGAQLHVLLPDGYGSIAMLCKQIFDEETKSKHSLYPFADNIQFLAQIGGEWRKNKVPHFADRQN